MNKRKNRGGPIRTQRSRSVIAEGVYNNAHFMHAATSQVGNIVRLKTASGVVWEGIFKTFSSNFEVVLEVAVKVENPDGPNSTILAGTSVDKLIFKPRDILNIVAKDVDLTYPVRDTFQTDTAIVARFNGIPKLEEKKLEPWIPSAEMNGGDCLELDNAANGWDANDMFRKNEQEYGVTSTFDHSLRGYTVPLQHSDSPDYKEAEAKANQIAAEIESQPQYKARLELENGDEETVFAAVVRPANNNNNNGSETNGKYIPPAKRKNQNSGKLVRSTPPPSQNSSAQTTPSPKSTVPPVSYPPHPMTNNSNNVHNAHAPPPQHVQQQANIAPPPPNQVPHHPRPHSHTPPHGFNNPMHQPVPAGPQKPHINGDSSKQMHRGPRNVYQSSPNVPVPPPQQPPQPSQPPQQPYQEPPIPKNPEMGHNANRHRDDPVKDLHVFAQEFKLAPTPPEQALPPQMPPQQPPPPQMVEQQIQQIPQQPPNKPPQQNTPPQPSSSPPQDIDKVTNTLKKSTLNPNAKEFVLNPAAKPFQPRSPSTPSASRPHTPQTPSHSPYIPATVNGGHMAQPPVPVMMPMGYMMTTSQPQYQPQQQGNRLRKVPMGQMRTDVSQMQVASVTGQPLLAPAPLQQFVYQPGLNPQGYPQMHAVRMYDTPPQIQYLPTNPPTAPSPAQPPQFSQPAPPTQAPPQQYQAGPPTQGHHQFPLMCPLIPAQPHMMQGMQYLQQQPPPQHHILLPHHNPQPQHGPA